MVDEGTTLGDLRGLLDEFAHAMFGAGKKTRFRPGYYPFTEPSVAFDVECLVCGEFVLHRAGMITCPECNSSLRAGNDLEQAQLQFDSQAG